MTKGLPSLQVMDQGIPISIPLASWVRLRSFPVTSLPVTRVFLYVFHGCPGRLAQLPGGIGIPTMVTSVVHCGRRNRCFGSSLSLRHSNQDIFCQLPHHHFSNLPNSFLVHICYVFVFRFSYGSSRTHGFTTAVVCAAGFVERNLSSEAQCYYLAGRNHSTY